MLGERGTWDSHKPYPDLAGPLLCGPGALSLLQFTKTAELTLAGGRWMDPWHKASCRMLVGKVMQKQAATAEELDFSGTRGRQGVVNIGAIGERGTQGAHRLHPDLAGPLPCCPGVLTPQR
ncbi:hypothetical protein NDU88_007792 [Pleurodeles waltl]|uniref:Uncharacterized protein n=1 Tax=Pleurodeles waltl TaxID=8319 RepID=A0AAV7N4H1_PLEWA|nr:hypothetical protein NDU88_007792 [Pleurodeles waltl]